jgi:mono/diheme cytochrome c family protein
MRSRIYVSLPGSAAPAFLVALVGAASAVVAADVGSDPASTAERGRAIYEQRCAICHGTQGKGDGPEAPFLSPRPASLLSAGTSVKSDGELLDIIANGKPRTAMPGWKDTLTEDQRQDVLAYIRSLIHFHKSLTPPPPQTQ